MDAEESCRRDGKGSAEPPVVHLSASEIRDERLRMASILIGHKVSGVEPTLS